MQRKNKKKVGRPIAYKGDPNASNLTEAERRRIKRRIANRESARRVRARRQETLEELQVRVSSQLATWGSLPYLLELELRYWTVHWCMRADHRRIMTKPTHVYALLCLLHPLCCIAYHCPALQMNHINAHNSEMVKHIADVEGHTALLKGQLQQTEMHWNRAVDDNARLHQQMAMLSAKLKVICAPLPSLYCACTSPLLLLGYTALFPLLLCVFLFLMPH